jgi:beta-lactamase class A
MLNKTLPAYYVVGAVLLGAIVPSYFLFNKTDNSKIENNSCNEYKIARLSGYKFVKPLIYAETACESKRYNSLKLKIEKLIQDYTKQGKLNKAAVYFRDFRLGEWTMIGENEQYKPGSLIKVPIMMAILKLSERDPSVLQKQCMLPKQIDGFPTQNITDKTIELGKVYTVKELLKYMIAYSDNNATALLAGILDVNSYKKMFVDLGLTEPNLDDPTNFQISAKEYSIFIKALYNASYLNIDNSEYGASLLNECTFRDGLSKGLPNEVQMAHKFGESGTNLEHQLHETGVIYMGNTAYMLTVMTKGKELKGLSEVLAAISKMVYEEMSNSDKKNS